MKTLSIQNSLTAKNVESFDCKRSLDYKPSSCQDFETLLEGCKLLCLKNIEKVSNLVGQPFKDLVKKPKDEKVYIIGVVPDSDSAALGNLPKVKKIKLPSLQKRIESKQISFPKLCEAILTRFNTELQITNGAILLLAIELQDRPGLIFDKSRGIYDLGRILRYAMTRANNQEINIDHILVLDRIHEHMLETKWTISPLPTFIPGLTESDKGVIFEVIVREYAKRYQNP